MTRFALFATMRHYVGKVRTIRNETRTAQFLNTLPADVQKDIGWPAMYDDRCGF